MDLPADFLTYTRTMMGEALFDRFLQGLAEEPPASVRVNPLKSYYLPRTPVGRVPWCNVGFYLSSRQPYTFDPLFHAGLYYVQEASSMFVHQAVAQLLAEPVTMLDLCAAPGGKSTVLRTQLPPQSVLVCNEPVRQRAQVLSENMQKFGHRGVLVTNNYPRDFQRSGLTFDAILADVPCSGEGMFRKDEGAIAEWSVQNVERCSQLQRQIVADVWPCLKPGGYLIYSTCTYNTKENEENVRWICESFGADVVALQLQPSWNVCGSLLTGFDAPVYRFIPGVARGEGLFMAVLRKPADGDVVSAKGGGSGRLPVVKNAPQWLAGDFCVAQDADRLVAIPRQPQMQAVYESARKHLNLLHAGITLGMLKGRDLIPDQPLAMSAALDKAAFPRVELDYAAAVSYLRKEVVVLPPDTPRGFVVVTFKGVALGFVKNVGNRANNLYPQAWRIKSTHTPADPVTVLDVK